MVSRRSLTPFVAAVAATTLSVTGVFLLGTAPVSAAPALSAECVSLVDTLEEEFGDVDIDPDFDEDALDALFLAYEEASEALLEELDTLQAQEQDAVGEAEDAAEALILILGLRDLAEVAVTEATTAVADAEAALATAEDGGDPGEIAEAEAALEEAQTTLADVEAALVIAEDAVPVAEAAVEAADAAVVAVQEQIAAVEAEIEALDVAFEADVDAILGDLEEIDINRLLDLLTQIALECNDDDTSNGGGGTGNGGTGSGSGSGSGSGAGSAPVATPVSGRASYTG